MSGTLSLLHSQATLLAPDEGVAPRIETNISHTGLWVSGVVYHVGTGRSIFQSDEDTANPLIRRT